MIELLIAALELLGLALVLYSSLQLLGIDPIYVLKLGVSRRSRLCREQLYRCLEKVVPRRLQLVAEILGVDHLLDGATPSIKLNLRESKNVGGKYVWGRKIIRIDVPKTCRVEDLLPSLDHELVHFLQDAVLRLDPKMSKFVVEGMASLVELLLHGEVRGYRKELLEYITWCLSQDRNHLCSLLVHLGEDMIRGVLASEVHQR